VDGGRQVRVTFAEWTGVRGYVDVPGAAMVASVSMIRPAGWVSRGHQ
jgi:hypothetical protein